MTVINIFHGDPKYFCFPDQDLVPEPAHQVEAEVHERPGAGGAAVLLHPRHPRTQAHVHRGQALVSGQKIFKVQKISMTT